jgi:hypothetical protein
MTAERATRLLTWDAREQINLDDLAQAVEELSAEGTVYVQEADTESDFYAIVLSNHRLTPEELEAEWFRLWTDDLS